MKICKYNIMLYEPDNVSPNLKIAGSVFNALEAKANSKFTDIVIPELAKQGLIKPGTSLDEFIETAHQIPTPIEKQMGIPFDEQFVINVTPYEIMGEIPRVLGDFARMYAELAPAGIDVTFFNTAIPKDEKRNDYRRLAETEPDTNEVLLKKFPAIYESTWVSTTSLKEPMPREFSDVVAERRGGKPNGSAAKRLMLSEGTPCSVAMGDSIVMRAQDEAVNVIFNRLKYIRSWEGFERNRGK